MSKIYSKTDYIHNSIPDPLGSVLRECFENYINNDFNIRNTVLENVLNYKLTLNPESVEYNSCSDILSSNYSEISYTWIADKLGYMLISNPRKSTDRLTLDSFEHDIAHGNLQPTEEYTGEYFSLVFEFLRRSLVIDSINWSGSESKEVSDTVLCINKRWNLFNRYFSDNFDYPKFIIPIIDIKYSPKFINLCFSPETYEQWDLTWETFLGHKYHEWDRIDQIYYESYYELSEQFLNTHYNMVTTMTREELIYYAELSLYQGCYTLWKFLNGDCDGSVKNEELNKLVERLKQVGSVEGSGLEKYKIMSEELKKNASLYYDLDEVQNIIGWKIIL